MALKRKTNQDAAPAEVAESPSEHFSIGELLEQLCGSDVELSHQAAERLAKESDETLSDAIINLNECQDEFVIDILLLEGQQRASDMVVSAMSDLLASEEPGVRNRALELMSQMPEQVLPIMPELLANPDKDVRILSMNMLNYMPNHQIVPLLLKVIAEDAEINVVAQAMDTLSGAADASVLSAVEGVKARFPDESYIQFLADNLIDQLTNQSDS